MIELEQKTVNDNVAFDVSGFKHEVFFVQKWLSHYGLGDLMSYDKKTLFANSGNPMLDQFSTHKAFVEFTKGADDITKEDFASIFKMAFAKFELDLPDASNTKSTVMERLDRMGAMADSYAETHGGLTLDAIALLREAAEEPEEEPEIMGDAPEMFYDGPDVDIMTGKPFSHLKIEHANNLRDDAVHITNRDREDAMAAIKDHGLLGMIADIAPDEELVIGMPKATEANTAEDISRYGVVGLYKQKKISDG